MNDHPLEKEIEGKFRKAVEADGNMCLKFTVRKGWPDRIVMLGMGVMFFIEFKRKNEKLRKLQDHIKNELETMGYDIYKIDTIKEAFEIYHWYKDTAEEKGQRHFKFISKNK